MAIYEFEGKRPSIGKTSFVFPSASVIGDVTIGEECFIGAGAVLRADYGTIKIGDHTSIQENVVIHAREKGTASVGSNVQIGHGAVLHNCFIHNNAVVGMGSVVADFVTVGNWAIVGEGAVVKGNVGPEQIAVGIPAKEIRAVTLQEKQEWQHYKDLYADLARVRYKKGLKKISP